MRVLAQVRREEAKMNAPRIRVLLDYLTGLTRKLAPEAQFTNRSTRARLDLLAKVHGDTLFVVRTKVDKLEFAAGDTIEFPLMKGKLNDQIETSLKRLIDRRLPLINLDRSLVREANDGEPDPILGSLGPCPFR